MRKIICPECGAEFVPEKEDFISGTWTPKEDSEIVSLYNNNASILEISEQLNRSPDAVRNRLYILRNKGGRAVKINVSVTAAEYDEMRTAYKEQQAQNLKTCKNCVSRYICPLAEINEACSGYNDKEVFTSLLTTSVPGIAWDKKLAFIEKQQKEALK